MKDHNYMPFYNTLGKPMHVRLPRRLAQDVEAYCKLNNISISSFLRDMLEKRLEVKLKYFQKTQRLRKINEVRKVRSRATAN